jgi:16S rRNA (uracil1498-N3)-methyltransferase
MPAERYYMDSDLIPSQLVSIEDREFHHLAHVMRAELGEAIELVNGQGTLAQGRVEQILKHQALIRILESSKTPKKTPRIILAQAIPRINRLDFIVEKGTELGMNDLWLFPGQRSERKSLTEHQLERLKGLTIAAMKQSGTLFLPEISVMPPLKDWKNLEFTAYFGDLSPEAPPFLSTIRETPIRDGLVFFIGPESGFTEDEEKKLKELDAIGVKLHSNILRTDTASLVALSLITSDT